MARQKPLDSASVPAQPGVSTVAGGLPELDVYRLLLENSLDLVSLLSPSGIILYASPAHEKVLGYRPAEVVGRNSLEFVHPDDLPLAQKALAESLRSGTVWLESVRFRHRDGHDVVLEGMGIVVVDGDGRPRGVIASSRDITERVRLLEAEQSARRQAEELTARLVRLQAVMGALAGARTREEVTQVIVREAVAALGMEAGAVMLLGDDGQTMETVAASGFEPEVVDGWRRFRLDQEDTGVGKAIRRGDILVMQTLKEQLRRRGTRRALTKMETAAVIPLLADDAVLGAAVLAKREPYGFQDTDRGLAQALAGVCAQALVRARLDEEAQTARATAERIAKELRKANEAKDAFLGMVSHELRTPLTSIYGGIRLLRHRYENEPARDLQELLNDMQSDSERLRRLLDDLMALARAELGDEVMTEPVLLQRVLEAEVASLRRQRPGRTVYVNAAKRLPTVCADSGYLGQVLRNLLSNADKYSPPDTPIEVEVAPGDGQVVISVLDRGPGVSRDERERIFDRFYRSERTARRTGGMGIGLAVCKTLVELQSGRIWAEPRKGGGLKVSFTLPLFGED